MKKLMFLLIPALFVGVMLSFKKPRPKEGKPVTEVIKGEEKSSFGKMLYKRNIVGPVWWNFIGTTYAETFDPWMYVYDPNQIPACFKFSGTIPCEIKAWGDHWNPIPDLTMVVAWRYPQ